MNIQMQLAGLGVLILLLLSYIKRRQVGLFTEIYFRRTLLITIANVLVDIASVVAINHQDCIPAWLCLGLCRTYLALLIWTGCFGLLYICQDIYTGRSRISVQTLFGSMAVIGTLLVYLLPISIYRNGRTVYTEGVSVYVTYAFCIYFLILTLSVAIFNRRRMNRIRVEAVICWNILWIAAATIQFFFNGILLVGYASSLGMMILYFKLENPDAALDRETGVFNSHVFYMYLKQMFDRGKSVSILMISIDQRFLDKSAVDEERVLDIIDYLRQFEGVKVFKGVNCDFVLMFEKKEFYEDSKNQIIQRFHDDWNGMTYEPLFLGIADSLIAESSDEIYHLIRYFKQHYNMLNVHKLIEIDRGMVEERRKYAAMVKTIGDALREDRVEVFYQPIYNVKKNRFVSAEALVRIRNLDGTLIQPGEFIPVAESTGIISQLGERVFEKVCQFITEQKIWEIGIEYIEINLSVHQCESHSLARRYLAIMNKYGVDPTMINFEITESGTIQTKALFMNNMKSLMDSGATFTLDDFGNGESNLNYIVDMPVEIVKFDRYMTKAYFEKSRGKVVMETTTDMILKLGLKIVSEGVETAEQLETVKSLGVQYIQGYYFSRPLPQEAFLGFIREWAG